jgi:hypothetical protein
MKKLILAISLIGTYLFFGCAGSSKTIKFLEEPQNDRCMIIGNVIIENINQEFAFENWGLSADLVFLGKDNLDSVRHYKVPTDNKGYYCLPNLPQGQYVLKAIILPVAGGIPVIIVNDWTSANSKFYRMRHPERSFEYTTDWFPPVAQGKVINYNIVWFGLRIAHISDLSQDAVGEILVVQSSKDLDGNRFYENGYPYTRLNPLTFYQNKFPESGWWK